MSKLDELIKYFKEKTKGYNELEKVRFIYLYLGSRMAFDSKFTFGNTKERRSIYNRSINSKDALNKNLESNIIICKSLSYLFEFILKSLGMNVMTVVSDDYTNDLIHVNNNIIFSDGTILSFDLESDLRYIQSRSRTRFFGLGVPYKSDSLSRYLLEQIDLKLGFISAQNYYYDDYFYFLKSMIDTMDFLEKVDFLLVNLDIYNSRVNMGYVEFREFFAKNLMLYLTLKERRKIHMLDLFYEGSSKYILGIMLDDKNNSKVIYIYDKNLEEFINISPREFMSLSLKSKSKIPRLKC